MTVWYVGVFPSVFVITYLAYKVPIFWSPEICYNEVLLYTVFQKKTPTHIVGYKLMNSCLILIIFDIEIPDIIWHRMTA